MIHLAHVARILIPPRVRQQILPEKAKEMADSILNLGLMQPIVLRQTEEGLLLVAGETRLTAMRMLHSEEKSFCFASRVVEKNMVPYVLFENLTEDQALELELEENIRRTDVSWQDRTAALARLHALRQKQDPSHTLSDTMTEIGYAPKAGLGRLVELANWLGDPDVQRAGSEREAMKVVSFKLEKKMTQILVGKLSTKSDRLTLLEGDAFELLAQLPDAQFDVLITDPPYGQKAHEIDADMLTSHSYRDTPDVAKKALHYLATETPRVLKPQSHAYVFCNIRMFFWAEELFLANGWHVWPRPLIWAKNGGHGASIDYGPTYRYECILFAHRQLRPLAVTGRPDVLQHSIVQDKAHPAEKPVSLYVDLLERSLSTGLGNVLDPFAGSGTVFAAANQLKLRATGIEKEPEYIALARKRVDDITRGELA